MKINFALFITALCITTVSCKDSTSSDAEVSEPIQTVEVPLTAKSYTVDTTNSVIKWKGSKPTGTHEGTLMLEKGKVFMQDDMLETGSFTIDMSSITVTDPAEGKEKTDLENHLKGLKEGKEDHFFNTTKYPTGSFEITGISSEKKDGQNTIEGNLTLKDITKNISFPALIKITADSLSIVSDEFKINRTLWNINYSSKSVFENLGDKYIDDDILLQVKVKACRK